MTTHRAKKSLGQNFLVDANQQRRIVAALEAGSGDTVIEIGPGQGALTRHIAGSVARLFLVELDRDLAPALENEFADDPAVTVIQADVLDTDLREMVGGDMSSVKVVGNIPYNITTPIIFRLLERELRPERIVIMIQREVADRILAGPGESEYGALSVGVQSVARAERLFNVGRGSFRPVPRVDSTVLLIRPISPPPLTARDEEDLRDLTRTVFSWRRKQLQKTLRSAPAYALDSARVDAVQQQTGIALDRRPEQLAPDQFISLARALRDNREAANHTSPRAP
ncbi:MAG: ribosomal RNA small subunit methyltransferase A [Gemmatimonadetes bacterium]|nr:ribosomal RNA small subunit methyltransferase A [Gemmatimonadota bacterium]